MGEEGGEGEEIERQGRGEREVRRER